MGQVTIRIGGYSHPVSCQDGQEDHLMRMAAEVDRRVSALRAAGLQFGETRMLLLAALQLADETADLTAEVAALKAGGAVAPAPVAAAEPDPAVAEQLDRVAAKIEAIVAVLEGA